MAFTRAKNLMLRVTFPNGKIFCYRNATDTFLDVLREIGIEQLQNVKLDVCYLPIFGKEIYPKFKDCMKPLCDGWYVNTQSDTSQKYMQLSSIKQQLNLDIKLEIGKDFVPQEKKKTIRQRVAKDNLLVKLPNGEYVGGENPKDTFLEAIWEIGPNKIKQKGLEFAGRTLMTTTQLYPNQIQVDKDIWVYVPNSTKDKYKVLRVIAVALNINLEITLI